MTWMFVYFSLYTVALRALKSILATHFFPFGFPRRCYFWNFDRTVVLPKFWPDGIFTKILSRAVFLSEFFPGWLFFILPDGLFFTAWSNLIFTGSKLTTVWPVILTGRFNRWVPQKRAYLLAGQYYWSHRLLIIPRKTRMLIKFHAINTSLWITPRIKHHAEITRYRLYIIKYLILA